MKPHGKVIVIAAIAVVASSPSVAQITEDIKDLTNSLSTFLRENIKQENFPKIEVNKPRDQYKAIAGNW